VPLFPAAAGTRIATALVNHAYALADTNVTTVTATAVTDLSTVYTIAANDAAVGAAYRLTAGGNGTQGSTGQNLTFGLYLGGTLVGQAITVQGSSTATWAVNDNFRWSVTGLIVCATIGGSGTWFGEMRGALSDTSSASVGAAGSTLGFADANVTAVTKDTTVGQTLAIRANWGSTTGAPTISCRHTVFERLG
jgi:hypothetical protein